MSAAAGDSDAPLLDENAESARLAAAEAAALAAAVSRRAAALERKCCNFSDAEDICVQLVCDVVDDMFMEMQVLEETTRSFAVIAHCAVHELFRSVTMGALQADAPLDRVARIGTGAIATPCFAGAIQQVLKPDMRTLASDDDDVDRSAFLRQLSTALETQVSAAHTAFLVFPASAFASPHVSVGRSHHYHANSSSGKPIGAWSIPVRALSAFLLQFIAVTHLCVPPSAVQFVVDMNRSVLAKQQQQRALSTLTLAQVQICVQKALFAAEEESMSSEQAAVAATMGVAVRATAGAVSSEQNLAHIHQQQRVFQTEVLRCFAALSGTALRATATASAAADDGDNGDDANLLLACYLDESDPAPSPIDRNVPSSLARKPTAAAAAAKHGLARKVVMAMKPGPGKDSKWLSLRTSVRVHDSTTTEVSIHADLSVSVAGDSTMSPPPPPPQQQHRQQLSAKSSLVALAVDTAKSARTNGAIVATDRKVLSVKPDAAALSNIFSLGTPRQMSAEELARRNDILALLEREELRNARRMANASVAAMVMPAVATLSDESNKSYQAYVASHSSLTVPAAPAPATSSTLSPTRPPEKAKSGNQHQSRELALRTKFDLEREPPPFVVSDGNAHVREKLNALELALCSPIKRSKVRSTREPTRPVATSSAVVAHYAPSVVPASPVKVSETGAQSHVLDPHRPVHTASSSHLPQIDTSRLAVGVRAVVRGVEKRGPKRSPSRKSRLKLHNYNSELETATTELEDGDKYINDAPPSPIKRPSQSPEGGAPGVSIQQQQHAPVAPVASGFLPRIPPVSPIKASPHRKHVQFRGSGNSRTRGIRELDDELGAVATPAVGDASSRADESLLTAAGRRTVQTKQSVWEAKTASPPRVRNRFFASGATTKKAHKFHPFFGQSGAAVTGAYGDISGDDDDELDGLNLFKPQLEAPRRSHLPVSDRD